ncbi:MAG TPA: hypothetical protein ENK91_14105 [Bacteroidetes bacterium]|nr:hypothetical protein [Bacteroidota bacterium]
MKFRFHWGWAIAVFYTSFVAVMVYFVIYSKSVDHSLVRDNYYDYDVGYEKLIGQKKRNSASLKNPVKIMYNSQDKNVMIEFPKSMEKVDGEVWFYRVNNEKLDKKIPIKLDSSKSQVFDIKDFVKGKWKMSVDWVGDEKPYLDEQEFYFK